VTDVWCSSTRSGLRAAGRGDLAAGSTRHVTTSQVRLAAGLPLQALWQLQLARVVDCEPTFEGAAPRLRGRTQASNRILRGSKPDSKFRKRRRWDWQPQGQPRDFPRRRPAKMFARSDHFGTAQANGRARLAPNSCAWRSVSLLDRAAARPAFFKVHQSLCVPQLRLSWVARPRLRFSSRFPMTARMSSGTRFRSQ
jgi:hypothetical protein